MTRVRGQPRPADFTVPAPPLIQVHPLDPAAARAELLRGLRGEPPAIPPKYFYDALGARLFAAITELPEYTPTRTEAAIMAARLPEIARALDAQGCTLIDLGAGNCEKAARLFAALRPAQYVALDISVDYLAQSLDCLQRQYLELPMLGVGIDFTRALDLPPQVPAARRLFFYPGSSIGNFTPVAALAFLRALRAAAGDDGALLIGVDLVKDRAVLDAAYDDALGVTAAFNLNVLNHVNALVGADFDVRDWRHVAFYNEAQQRIEMHLEARRDVNVRLPGGALPFAAGRRIHTENSYKYTVPQFAQLMADAGFAVAQAFTDDRDTFALFAARAV
ncbi:MAG: L-histidine N(alpha)-methyltransferase [Betaproteobacteria bacterium]